MSDIFISYSNKDRPWVERFAKTLGTHGWSVWWDRDIPTGQTFDTVIEKALESAKCAIVVWSENAVASKWVRSEAADALERMILLPVRIDNTKLPLEFRRIQTKSLIDWKEGSSHSEFDKLVEEIERLAKVAARHCCTRHKILVGTSSSSLAAEPTHRHRGGDREWPHAVVDFDSHSNRIDD